MSQDPPSSNPPPSTPTSSTTPKPAPAQSEATSCGHETADGGPCTVCEPRKSWVAAGRMPENWKHVPWDALELKKHRIEVVDDRDASDKDIDDRPDPSIEEALKRSFRYNDDEASREMEQWPQVRLSKVATSDLKDAEIEPPPVPSFASSEEGSRRRRSSKKVVRRHKGKDKQRSQSFGSRAQIHKFVVPVKGGKRSRTVDVAFSIQVNVGPHKKHYVTTSRTVKTTKSTSKTQK